MWEAAVSREKEMRWEDLSRQVEHWAVSGGFSQQRPGQVILPLCLSLVREHLEWCVQSGASQYKKVIDILE